MPVLELFISILHCMGCFLVIMLGIIQTVLSDRVTFGNPDWESVIIAYISQLLSCLLVGIGDFFSELFIIVLVFSTAQSCTLLIACFLDYLEQRLDISFLLPMSRVNIVEEIKDDKFKFP